MATRPISLHDRGEDDDYQQGGRYRRRPEDRWASGVGGYGYATDSGESDRAATPAPGFETWLNNAFNQSGARVIRGGKNSKGAVYQSGPFRGKTMDQATEIGRKIYAGLSDGEKLSWEKRGRMEDVRSQREMSPGATSTSRRGGDTQGIGRQSPATQPTGSTTRDTSSTNAIVAPGVDFGPPEKISLSLRTNGKEVGNFAPASGGSSKPFTQGDELPSNLQKVGGIKYAGRDEEVTKKKIYDDAEMGEAARRGFKMGGPGSERGISVVEGGDDARVYRTHDNAKVGTYSVENRSLNNGKRVVTVTGNDKSDNSRGGYVFTGSFDDLSPSQKEEAIVRGGYDPNNSAKSGTGSVVGADGKVVTTDIRGDLKKKRGTINGMPAQDAIGDLRVKNEVADWAAKNNVSYDPSSIPQYKTPEPQKRDPATVSAPVVRDITTPKSAEEAASSLNATMSAAAEDVQNKRIAEGRAFSPNPQFKGKPESTATATTPSTQPPATPPSPMTKAQSVDQGFAQGAGSAFTTVNAPFYAAADSGRAVGRAIAAAPRGVAEGGRKAWEMTKDVGSWMKNHGNRPLIPTR